jgi:hypothetical protein
VRRGLASSLLAGLLALACAEPPRPRELCRAFDDDPPEARADALAAFVAELRGEPIVLAPAARSCVAARIARAGHAVDAACAGLPDTLETGDVPRDLGVPAWLRLASFVRSFSPSRAQPYARIEAEWDALAAECALGS